MSTKPKQNLYGRLAREVNRIFLVNEHCDLSIFALFLSLVNALFLYSECKQISILEK